MSRRRRKSVISYNEGQIENLSHDGHGVARIDGKTTFVQGALPGEHVKFQYQRRQASFDKAHCVEVFESSPLRVEPPCEHYEMCGGCSMQHLELTEQIKFKQNTLMELLSHQAETKPKEILPPLQARSLGYRHKARLSVRYVEKKGTVLIGFRERANGRFIADIKSCEVLHPAVGKLIPNLKELITSFNNLKDIAQIEVAVGENQTALILRHLSPMSEKDLEALKTFGEHHKISWYLQPGGLNTIKPLNPNTPMLQYSLAEYNLNYHFKPTDFTQVNPSMNERMIALALKLLNLNKSDKVLDLFCGLGNFSLPIAQKAKEVVGVEGDNEMVKRASDNAAFNNINNASFFMANLFEENLTCHSFLNQSFDKILLDPPRAGAKELCEQIELFGAKRLVYVSCSPQTLARDIQILLEKGYELQSAGVMDMFPHTAHVESIALLTKQ